jgi:hypothetical protein
MKPSADRSKNSTPKSAGEWCKKAAVRGGIFLMYVVGIYLAAMAWIHEPWYKDAAIRIAATLAGIAVFAAAWYLGTRYVKEPVAPAPAEPPRRSPRLRPKGRKR